MSRRAYISFFFAVFLAALALSSGRASLSRKAGPSSPGPIGFSFSDESVNALADTSLNVIADPSGSMRPLMDKLLRLRNGEAEHVSILHIGDSHIQAGFMTAPVRILLQESFGNAGRGLIVPLKLAGTNEPTDYAVTSSVPWVAGRCTDKDHSSYVGPGGLSLSSDRVQVDFTVSANEPFCIIRAFHHEKAPALEVADNMDSGIGCTMHNGSTYTTYLLDTLTNKVSLTAAATNTYNTQTWYGFSLENGRPGILYHSIGLNGAAYEHYGNFPAFFEAMSMLRPDLVIVSLGTNDTSGPNYDSDYFRARIDTFVKAVKRAGPDAAILLTTPMENHRSVTSRGRRTYQPNANIAKASNTIVSYCADNGLACWDLYGAAGGEGSNDRWTAHGLFHRDRLHMTVQGYTAVGEMLYDAVIKYYNRTITTE